jgi:hypothetical protein
VFRIVASGEAQCPLALFSVAQTPLRASESDVSASTPTELSPASARTAITVLLTNDQTAFMPTPTNSAASTTPLRARATRAFPRLKKGQLGPLPKVKLRHFPTLFRFHGVPANACEKCSVLFAQGAATRQKARGGDVICSQSAPYFTHHIPQRFHQGIVTVRASLLLPSARARVQRAALRSPQVCACACVQCRP